MENGTIVLQCERDFGAGGSRQCRLIELVVRGDDEEGVGLISAAVPVGDRHRPVVDDAGDDPDCEATDHQRTEGGHDVRQREADRCFPRVANHVHVEGLD